MTNEFFNETVWEKAWKEDQHTAVNKMKKAGIDAVHVLTIGQSHSTSRRLTKKAGKEKNGL